MAVPVPNIFTNLLIYSITLNPKASDPNLGSKPADAGDPNPGSKPDEEAFGHCRAFLSVFWKLSRPQLQVKF